MSLPTLILHLTAIDMSSSSVNELFSLKKELVSRPIYLTLLP